MAPTPLQLALSEDTPPEVLVALASGADPQVRRTARLNPRCPTQATLTLNLAEERPAALTSGQLDWLARQGPFAVGVALKHPGTPDTTLELLILAGHTRAILSSQNVRKGPWMLARAGQNPELLRYLATSRSGGVPWGLRRAAWKLLQSAPGGMVAEPSESAQTVSAQTVRARLLVRKQDPALSAEETALIKSEPKLQRLAARHPLLPIEVLEWLDAAHPYTEARETLLHRLENHELDADLLLRVAHKGDWEGRAAVARNPWLPDTARAGLAADPDWWVRAAVAENPNAQPAELEALAGDADHVTIREHVAAHPHTPGTVLLALTRDGERAVRLGVAQNPSAPPEALAALAHDERFGTREAVAAHPLTLPDTLSLLAKDPHERVRLVANLRLRPLNDAEAQSALDTRRRNVKLALTSQPELPAPVLDRLAADRSPRIRAEMGLHPGLADIARTALKTDSELAVRRVALAMDGSTPAQMLTGMPRHDARVRQGLSRNPQAPAGLLETLSDDPLADVRLSVVLNPAASGPALERRLPEQTLRPAIRQHPRYAQVRSPLQDLEAQEASQPDATPEALELLGLSDALRVRKLVARHPHTATPTLLRLADDALDDVRRALLTRSGTEAGGLPESVQHRLAEDSSLEIRTGLAERSDLQISTMLTVARRPHENVDVLLRLARHERITPEVLGVLARSPQVDARCAVAVHPATSLSTLLELSRDARSAVQQDLLRRPDCPPQILRVLSNVANCRRQVAEHPNTDGPTLETLSYNAGYARLRQYEAWLKNTPLHEAAPVQSWLRWANSRASAQAFDDLPVLRAVILHPAATRQAILHACRLVHPEIREALDRRNSAAALNTSRPFTMVSGQQHD
ncbi:hypothetical protein [Deinococcus marmoris]|uniref:HEAT repeat n=1 Tax=Deinococcus marmoris TaxID=249408 RepID=A0A1U7NZX1_9DEIO|nr:hypothetical protein [Deinococcus marmoris]OLV18466.1 HEAT repeat [Deinococcus marmoris]